MLDISVTADVSHPEMSQLKFSLLTKSSAKLVIPVVTSASHAAQSVDVL